MQDMTSPDRAAALAEVGTLLPFITAGPSSIRRVSPEQAKWFAAVTDTGHSRRIARLGKKA